MTTSRLAVVRAVAALAVSGTVLLASAGLVGADPPKVQASDHLRDLQTAVADPTDGAHAHVVAEEPGDGTTVVRLKVTGLDHAAVGTTLGAHAHVGPCVEGNGAAAGPHYNSTGGSVVSDQTEVWLDFTVELGGIGRATAIVPFTIAPGGAQSVVVHALPTQPNGAAGPRLACLPVAF